MRRFAALAAALSFGIACGTSDEEPSESQRKYESKHVDVTGQVKLHPLEVKWRAEQGLELPSLVGLTVNVEDALRATSGHPALETVTSDAEGRFEARKVDVTNVNLALVASVQDPTEVLAPCGYGLIRGQPPGDLLDMPVYVVSHDFLDHIAVPTGYSSDELLDLGFMFVQIADEALETGIAGAKLALRKSARNEVVENSGENPIWYLNETASGLAETEQTTASGVLLYVPGFGAKEFTALKDGSTFELKLAGARKNFVLNVFIAQE